MSDIRSSILDDPGLSTAEIAAYWVMRSQEKGFTDADRCALTAWLAEDENHPKAYASVAATWREVGQIADEPAVLVHRRAARLGARARTHWRSLSAAAMLATCVIAGSVLFSIGDFGADPAAPQQALAYRTGLGERSDVRLEDGSRISLNTETTVRAHFERSRRVVSVDNGQALFEVAHDPDRPFIVRAGDRDITALGTSFDVRVDRHPLEVTLIHGRIRVAQAQGAPAPSSNDAPILDQAGQQLRIVAAGGDATVSLADLNEVTSWRSGRLVFKDSTLADAVAEMSRYTDVQLALADENTASLRVSGTFKAGDVQSFVDALQLAFPVEVTQRTADRITLSLAQ